MNKKVKMLTFLAFILSTAVSFAGCSDTEIIDQSSSNTANEKIDIDDISWNIDVGVIDDARCVLFNYTNNTQYTITNFKITFTEKSDIGKEEKENFYLDVQQDFDASDTDMADLKSRPISIHVNANRIVNPNESVSNINCYYYGGYFYLNDISHYNLVEPDIATIKYIDEDKIFTVHYDYTSKKYSREAETKIVYQWSKTDLGRKIPKPNVRVLESSRDDEIIFMFDAYDMSLEQFNDYVEECKEFGYTIHPSSFERYYSANNKEGYSIHLYYSERNYSICCTVSAPKTKSI